MLGVVLGFWMLEDGFNFRVMVVGACFGALGGMVLEPTTRDRAPSTPRPIPQVQAPSARHTVLGSRLLGFVFWMLGDGCQCLGDWHLALGGWCCMQGAGIGCLGIRVLGLERPVPNTQH